MSNARIQKKLRKAELLYRLQIGAEVFSINNPDISTVGSQIMRYVVFMIDKRKIWLKAPNSSKDIRNAKRTSQSGVLPYSRLYMKLPKLKRKYIVS